MTRIHDVMQYLEAVAPPVYQADYDNSGLLVGDAGQEVQQVLCCLDCTEAVVEEAAAKGCNLIVAHHPIVFRGLKRFTGKHYVERVVMEAIRKDIAIYAIHTNLDSVYYEGVNSEIARRIGLEDTRILGPSGRMKQLSVQVAAGEGQALAGELEKAGAGPFGKEQIACAITPVHGGERVEAVFPEGRQSALMQALKGLPVQVAVLEGKSPVAGYGMIGRLSEPEDELAFLKSLKLKMGVEMIRHTPLLGRKISTVAFCGGAGGFLLGAAQAQQADVFITADYKYHEFFDADGRLVIADIGHFESEQYTIPLLQKLISQKFSKFAVYATTVKTNPVRYL